VKGIHTHAGKETILKAIHKETGKELEVLLRERGSLRQLTRELLYKAGGLTGPQIGALFGIDYSAVSQESKCFREKLTNDKQVKPLHVRLLRRMLTVRI
jgi:hypothetical protein